MKKIIYPIVIIGSQDDPHVEKVMNRLESLGETAYALDFHYFPETITISLGEQITAIDIDEQRIVPSCVYVRNLGLGLFSAYEDDEQERRKNLQRTMTAYREKSDFIMSLMYRWEEAGVPIYNPPSTRHRVTKPFQLALLKKAGVPVPESLWSNAPSKVRQFAEGRRVVYKPVVGGAATQELAPDDLTEQRLTQLSTAPVTFQALLPGDDIRVYVIDNEIIASYRISTKSLDYRQNEENVESIDLTEEVYKQCIDAAKVIGLRFTGIDLKADANGSLKILELNPSPMFLGFDTLAGTDILGHLTQALLRHKN